MVKDTQKPNWNHDDLEIPDGDSRTVMVEVLDSDKLGKDKSMGKLELDMSDIQDMARLEENDGRWFPLQGVKSGQILLTSDILEQIGKDGDYMPSHKLSRKESHGPSKIGNNKNIAGSGMSDGKAITMQL